VPGDFQVVDRRLYRGDGSQNSDYFVEGHSGSGAASGFDAAR